jgi:hypothetical protein
MIAEIARTLTVAGYARPSLSRGRKKGVQRGI